MQVRTVFASVSTSALAVSLVWAIPAAAKEAKPSPPATAPDTAAPPAVPPQDAATNSNQVDDIIVTAQRRDESLSRVGISVVAVGADAIQDRGIKDLSDLVKLVPGFQASATYAGNPIYTLRGIGFNTRNASSTAPVGIYENESAVAYPYMSLGLLYDLERVEVLKGPQGTLYGRNATGGLINYVTGRPTSTPQGGLTIEAGNYQTINAAGFVSGPLGDAVRVRFAFNVLNRGEGYQRDILRGDKLGKLYQKAARLTVDLGTEGSPFTATLVGDYWKKDGDTPGQQAIYYITDASPATAPFGNAIARASIQPNPTNVRDVAFPDNTQYAASQRPYPGLLTDSEFYSGTAKLGFAFSSEIRLQSLTSYQHLRQRDVVDAAGVSNQNIVQDLRNTISSFSQEVRLIGESDRFNWSIGGYYARDKIDTPEFAYVANNGVIGRLRAIGGAVRAGNPANPYTAAQIANSFFNFRNISKTDTEVLAGFANAEFKVSDLIKVTLGGRYTKDKTDFQGCTYDTNGGSVPLLNTVYPLFGVPAGPLGVATLNPNECYTLRGTPSNFIRTTITNNIDQNNFAFRANIDITPSPTTLLYASVSRGFKSGGFPVIAGSAAAQFDPIRQEKLTAYEVGTKLGLFDRSVQVNLAAFYYDYKDRQVFGRVLDPIFTTLSKIVNAPRSREFGVEGELTWRITPGLSFHAAGTYLDSKILEFSDFTELGVPANIRGQPFTYTPKFSGTAGLSIDTPVSASFNFLADANVSYQDKSQADSAGIPLFRIDSYALFDGSIGFRTADNAIRVTVFGQNLFDKYYYVGVASGVDTVFRFPGMPRRFGIRAAFKF